MIKATVPILFITAALGLASCNATPATLEAGATALICQAAAGIDLAVQIEDALAANKVNVGTVVQTDTNTAEVVSTTVCADLGGTVVGTTKVTPAAAARWEHLGKHPGKHFVKPAIGLTEEQ
jgi:hypothetical protein